MLESSTPKQRRERKALPEVIVDIANRQRRRIPRSWIDKAVRRVIDCARLKQAEISVAVVNDQLMRQLNRRYLKHDYTTDVLSFKFAPSGRRRLSGELVVSAETAHRVSRRLGVAFRDELILYVVHGMLHLIGYDDQNESDRQEMWQAECDVLRQIGLSSPRYADSNAVRAKDSSTRGKS